MDFVQVSPVFFTCTFVYVCVHFVYVCGSIKFLLPLEICVTTTMIKIQSCPITQRNTCYSFMVTPCPHPQPWQPLMYPPSLQLCHFENSVQPLELSFLNSAWSPGDRLTVLNLFLSLLAAVFFWSPVEGHLGCCYFLAITNRAALNIYIQILVQT